jgi:hypothetical protein
VSTAPSGGPAFETHDGALLLPATHVTPIAGQPGRATYDGGVHAADGSGVKLSRHRGDEHVNRLPPRPGVEPAETVSGTWLYGGLLRPHFGLLLRECLGRLWAWQDHGPFDGVVFLPHGANPQPRFAAALRDMAALQEVLRLLGIAVPVRVPTRPTRFERLAVPEQLLFEPGEAQAPKAARLRALFRGLATGPVKLDGLTIRQAYVSRARLGPMFGRFLLERVVEENFARAGYAIIHPERLPLATQVAAYRGVRRIVFMESSAIHLGAPVIPDDAEIGVMWRGREPHPPMRRFIQGCGISRLHEFWGIQGFIRTLPPDAPDDAAARPVRFNPRYALTVPDFVRLGAQLDKAGFVPREAWHCPEPAGIEAAIARGLAARQRRAPGRRHAFVPLPAVGP